MVRGETTAEPSFAAEPFRIHRSETTTAGRQRITLYSAFGLGRARRSLASPLSMVGCLGSFFIATEAVDDQPLERPSTSLQTFRIAPKRTGLKST